MSDPSKDAVATLLKALNTAPHTYTQLATACGLTRSVVSKWVSAMREAGLVSVCGYLLDIRGYPTVAVFRWSPGVPDTPCPTKSPAQRVREWKARQLKAAK